MSLPVTNFSRHFPGIDNRLMPRYPFTEWSLVLSDLGMVITLAFFHSFGKHPSSKHFLKSEIQNLGKDLCIRFTMMPSIPSGPGHLLSSRFLLTSSTSCSVKFSSIWESGGLSSIICVPMFLCFPLSCAVESSRKKLLEEGVCTLLF